MMDRESNNLHTIRASTMAPDHPDISGDRPHPTIVRPLQADGRLSGRVGRPNFRDTDEDEQRVFYFFFIFQSINIPHSHTFRTQHLSNISHSLTLPKCFPLRIQIGLWNA